MAWLWTVALLALPVFLVLYGASLLVRVLAIGLERFAARAAAARQPRPDARPRRVTLTPTSSAQIKLGLVLGPVSIACGLGAFVYILGLGGGDFSFRRALAQGQAWWYAGALGVVLLGVALVFVGLRFDPAKGRRRCAGCWYDFESLRDDATCPECGRAARGACDLARTRRSRAMVILGALVAFASYFVWIGPSLKSRGWKRVVPTSLMIPFFEYLPDSLYAPPTPMTKDGSLVSRLWVDDELYGWQKSWLDRRAGRLLAHATDLRTAGRAVNFSTMQESMFPTALLRDALLGLRSTDRATAEGAAAVLNAAATHQGSEVGVVLSGLLSEVTSALGSPGWGPLSVGYLISRHGPATDEWATPVVATLAPAGTGAAQQRSGSMALGSLIRRNPALLHHADAMLGAGDTETRVEGVMVLIQAAVGANWGEVAKHDEALVARLRGLMHDPDDAVAAAALAVVYWLGQPADDWVGDEVATMLRTRETRRAEILDIARTTAMPYGALGPWILRDLADPNPGVSATAQTLYQAAQVSGGLTRERLEEALRVPGIAPAHAKAIRAELDRRGVANADRATSPPSTAPLAPGP